MQQDLQQQILNEEVIYMKKIIVAIDGPAGAGKSTIAKLVGEKLGYAYIDTGAMYRSVTWKFLGTGKDFDEAFIGALANKMIIEFLPEAKINRVFVDGTEVTNAIRTPEVTANVSRVAAIGSVREAMVSQQQRMGQYGGIIMDGRDIGTVVFPQAELKVFLTASVEERALRRYKENIAKGQDCDYEALKLEIAARDKADSEREISPLKQAEDAILLDTSNMNIDEVVEAILQMVEARS